MGLSFYDAIIVSVFMGVMFGILFGVKYLVKIERQQKKMLSKIFKIEELIVGAEKKILARLNKKKG
jgi:hypothetical protein